MQFDSPEAALVWADEREEAGDPRAELIRAELDGRAPGPLTRENWSRWLGRLSPKATMVDWSRGVLRGLAARPPESWFSGDLARLPVARALQRVSLQGVRVESGLSALRSLRELTVFGRLEAQLLPAVEQLTLCLWPHAVEPLLELEAPRLTALHTACVDDDEPQLLKSIASARWFPLLRTWTHRLVTQRGFQALLENRDVAARRGAGLTLLFPVELLADLAVEVRTALPLVEARVLRQPRPPFDAEDTHGPPSVSVLPRGAPPEYRLLGFKRRTRPNAQGTTPEWSETGPHVDLDASSFRTCGWCSGSRTTCVFRSHAMLERRFETTTYESWEYRCDDCSLFTRMHSSRTR